MSDTVIYWVIVGLLFLFIAWLLLVPAPGHDPLIQFQHAPMIHLKGTTP